MYTSIVCFVVGDNQGAARQPAGSDGAAAGGQQPPQQQVRNMITVHTARNLVANICIFMHLQVVTFIFW